MNILLTGSDGFIGSVLYQRLIKSGHTVFGIDIKRCIERIGEAASTDTGLLGHLLLVAAKVAQQEGLDNGYRVIINNGPDGGETVPHLHVHLLGGRTMGWPPG